MPDLMLEPSLTVGFGAVPESAGMTASGGADQGNTTLGVKPDVPIYTDGSGEHDSALEGDDKRARRWRRFRAQHRHRG